MAWFRRRRTTPEPDCLGTPESDVTLVPVASATALARTEQALSLLAAQSGQLHDAVTRLERRVDALSETVFEQLDAASGTEVREVRRHSEKVAAELGRLEINLAARLEAVRAEIDALAGEEPAEIDLRLLTPNDTGWQPARSA